MNHQRIHIITGPPGSGKTTLINALKEKGFNCSDEIARQVIIEEQQAGTNGTPWGDVTRFADLVLKRTKLILEHSKSVDFSDRGLLDLVAYLEVNQLPIPDQLKNFPYHRYYHKTVFFLPSWPEIYINDPQRLQTLEEQKLLETQLLKVYEEYGFEIVVMKKESVERRGDKIHTFHEIKY